MQIGYIGLGSMGGALARRLQLSLPLHVYDRDEAGIRGLAEAGATACSDVADLAGRCDVVMLCLPTSEHVREVVFGKGGLAEAARPGTLIVDQTTGDPTATRSMSAALSARGLELIDAPVSGGPKGAQAGTIAIMVGGSLSQYERIEPVMRAISSNVFHTGEVGTGHVAKLANNLVSAAQRVVAMEALALAVKNGMTPQKALDVMKAGSARNFFIDYMMEPHIISGKLASGFTLNLLHKDVRLACQLGIDSGSAMLYGNLTKEFLQIAINEWGPDTQVNALALVMDRLSGTHVVPADYTLT